MNGIYFRVKDVFTLFSRVLPLNLARMPLVLAFPPGDLRDREGEVPMWRLNCSHPSTCPPGNYMCIRSAGTSKTSGAYQRWPCRIGSKPFVAQGLNYFGTTTDSLCILLFLF
jgi:hypothetical protein